MRNMAFSLTAEQIRNGTKTVTRRIGWANLRKGQLFCAIVKGMGLKKGEKIERLAILRCISNRYQSLERLVREPVYGKNEARKEGFPEMSGADFVAFFCSTHKGCEPWTQVHRIEFEYVIFMPPV